MLFFPSSIIHNHCHLHSASIMHYIKSKVNFTPVLVRHFAHKSKCKVLETDPKLYDLSDLERFAFKCATAIGCSNKNAELMAHLLVLTDALGYRKHGLEKLEMYLKDLESGSIDGKASPSIKKESEAIAIIDGNNAPGYVVAHFALERAIEKAKCHGASFTTCCNGGYFGVGGLYSFLAAQSDVVGLVFSNSSPTSVAWGSAVKSMGINALNIGAPAQSNDYLNLEIKTSNTDMEEIRRRNENKQTLPRGWAISSDGTPITSSDCLDDLGLLPLGSPNFGHFGYGLALGFEVLTTALSGAEQFSYSFLVIEPERFAGALKARLSAFLTEVRGAHPIKKDRPVVLEGDAEKAEYAASIQRGALQYSDEEVQRFAELGSKLNIPFPPPMKQC